MHYIYKGIELFKANRKQAYLITLMYLLITTGITFVMEQLRINNGLLQIGVNIALIPLSYGLVKYFLSTTRGQFSDSDTLFSVYNDQASQSIFTNICYSIVYFAPTFVFLLISSSIIINNIEMLSEIGTSIDAFRDQSMIEFFQATIVVLLEIVKLLAIPIALLIPIMVYLGIKFTFVIHVVVDEEKNKYYFAALGESWDLTKKNFWKVFAIKFIYGLIGLVIGLLIMASSAYLDQGFVGRLINMIVSAVVIAYFTSMESFSTTALYVDITKGNTPKKDEN